MRWDSRGGGASGSVALTRPARSGARLQDLKLDALEVVHAGAETFPLACRVRAVPLARLLELIRPLHG